MEDNEVSLAYQLLLLEQAETRRLDLLDRGFLVGAHVVDALLARLPRNLLEVDYHHAAAGLERPADRLQGLSRVLEMVVSVAGVDEVDRGLGQLGLGALREDGCDVVQPFRPGALADVLDEGARDVHRVDAPARAYRPGEEHGEEPGPGADVGDRHPRLHAGRGEYLVPLPVDFAVLVLETLLPARDVGVAEERRVDFRFCAVLRGGQRRPQGGERGEKDRGESSHAMYQK